MTDIVEISGKKYRLVPIEEEKTQENRSGEAVASENAGILGDYEVEQPETVAKPKVFDWKKRLDEKRARMAKNAVLKKIPQQDAELGKFGNLIIGEGLTQIF